MAASAEASCCGLTPSSWLGSMLQRVLRLTNDRVGMALLEVRQAGASMRGRLQFAGSVAVLALTNVANAADVGVTPFYKAPPAPPAAGQTWTGVYVGAGVGFRSTTTDATVVDALRAGVPLGTICAPAAPVGGCVTSEPLNDTAARFSPYAGFNWQLTPQWVVGVEGDSGFARKTTTLNSMFYPVSTVGIMPTADNTFSVNTTWDASVRARVGYLVTPTILAY